MVPCDEGNQSGRTDVGDRLGMAVAGSGLAVGALDADRRARDSTCLAGDWAMATLEGGLVVV